MKIAFILAIFQLANVHAQDAKLPEPTSEVWSLGNVLYPMQKDSKTGSLISSACLEKKDQCMAFNALRSLKKFKLTEKELAGGKNPGAVICKKYLEGDVLILRDKKQNENAFCKFKDGSFLSAGALR